MAFFLRAAGVTGAKTFLSMPAKSAAVGREWYDPHLEAGGEVTDPLKMNDPLGEVQPLGRWACEPDA